MLHALTTTTNPYSGITYITRSETISGRNVNMHILQIDLTASGIGFVVSPHTAIGQTSDGCAAETMSQQTLAFMDQQHAQAAINVGFFLPTNQLNASAPVRIKGLSASKGDVYSGFEDPALDTPNQSYAIVANAPAINIDQNSHAAIVHSDTSTASIYDVLEGPLYNAFSGSAQIVTNGQKTVPGYNDGTPETAGFPLTPGNGYSNGNSWYDTYNARTAAGLTADNRLILFTVDNAGGSQGMRIGDVADLLISDYHVIDALSLDGGGSTTMTLQDPRSGVGSVVNASSNNGGANTRYVASSLCVFASPVPEPSTLLLLGIGAIALVAYPLFRRGKPIPK